MNYIPLNVETYYSFLSSAISIDKYVKEAKKLSLNMLGICDNNPYAFGEFAKECLKNNIKPIFGSKFNYQFEHKNYEICVFIKNENGYNTFCKIYKEITNNCYLGNFDTTDGLIFVIDASYINQTKFIEYLLSKTKNLLIGLGCYCKEDILKNENYLLKAQKLNLKTIPFPKIKAIKKNEGLTLKILEAIKLDKTLDYQDECTTPYFLLSSNSIKKIYKEESINSFEIFNDIDFNLLKKRGSLPIFNIENKRNYIFNLAYENLKKKNLDNEKYKKRLEYEIDIIDKMGYIDYFLCVNYYVKKAKMQKIVVGPGRGSAAGSLLAFALDITMIDPLKYNLIFERFLNPERITMPDIDVDFADYQRDLVIKIIIDKFHESKVKSIITFQRIMAKQAVKDIGKVFNYNSTDINLICKSLNNFDNFSEAKEKSKDFNKLLNESHYRQIINLAEKIETFPRQKGLHAAGIIINNIPLNEVLPIVNENNAPVPLEKDYLEELGFLKMDILSLKNLSIIEDIVNIIKKINPNFILENIPLDDSKTFNILNKGLTKAIFQLEKDGITNALKQIHIDSFNDIVCVNALYRPGPMENIPLYAKRKAKIIETSYISPILEPILKETYGIIVYQEQVMEIARAVANFSFAKADILRRAISKKDEKKLSSLKNEFIAGACKNNLTLQDAEKLYDYILKFGDYGFNKSHSVAYSLLSYQMAYLKANYPKEFFAAILNNSKSSETRYLNILNELEYFNIKLLPPSVNKSDYFYKIEENGLRLPLSEIKEINATIEKNILDERINGKYTDFVDFIRRIYNFHFGEKQILNIINAGALDEFNLTRNTLKKGLSGCLLYAQNFPNISEFTADELLELKPILKNYDDNIEENNALEFDVLSILLSGDLFVKYKDYINKNNIKTISYALENKNQLVKIIAKVINVHEINTKKNEKMGLIYCFDNYNQLKIAIFPKIYLTIPKIEKNDNIIIIGTLKDDEKGTSFIANNIIKLEDSHE